MPEDSALIWEDAADRRPRPRRPAPSPPGRISESGGPLPGGRIPLGEAHHQFGVPVSTLAGWARQGKVDALKEEGRWMVTPASVAARLSVRHGGRPRRTGREAGARAASGPTADGSAMLVPRDAWDKLMDQLGNLHEAGQLLAEARERAARAETEATFLRERLAEMRLERDRLLEGAEAPSRPDPGEDRPGWFTRLRAAMRRSPTA